MLISLKANLKSTITCTKILAGNILNCVIVLTVLEKCTLVSVACFKYLLPERLNFGNLNVFKFSGCS